MPNKPRKGLTHVSVKLDEDLLARLDADAATWSDNSGQPVHRTDVIRLLLDVHLSPLEKIAKKRAKA